MSGISLIDVGYQWFIDILNQLIEWFTDGLTTGYRELTESLFGTPTPKTSGQLPVGSPENEPWTQIYNALVGGEITLVALLILVVCVQARHTLRMFDFTSAARTKQVRRSAWTGGILIVTWYWIAATTLYLVDGFSIFLVPTLGTVIDSMIELLSITVSNPLLGLLLTAIGGFAMWALQALFFLREILLYVFVYAMPIGIAVAYGGVPILATIAKRVAIKFVPLAVMPLPVALLFRGYELLFATGSTPGIIPENTFFRYLIAISLPILSVWVVWRLFGYATPRLARTVRTAAGLTATAGAVVGAASVAGPWAGATAARWGPRAAAGHTAASYISNRGSSESDDTAARTDGGSQPIYRRTENDP